MQADPHKLDFRSDLLARLPGPGGLGPLGPIGGGLGPTNDLTRPPSLCSATGARLERGCLSRTVHEYEHIFYNILHYISSCLGYFFFILVCE